MKDVFVERFFEPAIDVDALAPMSPARRRRLAEFGVVWRESLLDRNGRRMLCRFEANDEAAVRDALRREHVEHAALWAGSVCTLAWPDLSAPGAAAGTPVLVQHRIEEPVTFADLRTLRNLCEWCLETWRIRLVRMLLSNDFRHVVYLYRAPDAESVRMAHRQAGLGLDIVWPYVEVTSCLPSARGAV